MQLSLKELSNKLGKSTLDALQLIKSKNIKYERRQEDIFLNEEDLIPQETIPKAKTIRDVLIPEISAIERKKITNQKQTDELRTRINLAKKNEIEQVLGRKYRNDTYSALHIATDLLKTNKKYTTESISDLEQLLKKIFVDDSTTDNDWLVKTALHYATLDNFQKQSLKEVLQRTQRLVNTAYALRNDADTFSLTMFLENENRGLSDPLQNYYRIYLEAILSYQGLTDELKQEIFEKFLKSETDFEFVIDLGKETLDYIRGSSQRLSSNKSLLNTALFVLKDQNASLDLVEKTRSLEWAHISLENMSSYQKKASINFNKFAEAILDKVNTATTDTFDTATFIRETSDPEFFDFWRKEYGKPEIQYSLFVKYMTASLYVAGKNHEARILAKNIDNELADQLSYIIGYRGKTCLYELFAKNSLHDASRELIKHWASYQEKLASEGCTRLKTRRYPIDNETVRKLKGIIDEIEKNNCKKLEKIAEEETFHKPDFIGLYDYNNKKAWRQKWKEFIAQYIINNNFDPKTLKVLCLPGPEALEIKEVYDQLGIQRQNIVGLELDKKRFDFLQTQVEGAKLINDDILSYLRKTNEKFDIIMVDADGFLDKHMFQALQKLFSKGIVSKKAVFGTNFFTTREGEEQKEIYTQPLQAELVELLTEEELKEWDAPENVKKTLGCEYNGVSVDSLKKLRDYGITGMIVKTLLGRQLTEINQAYAILPELERCKKAEQLVAGNGLFRTLVYNEHMRSHLQSFLKQVGLARLAPVMELYFAKAYFIERTERYSYKTATNAPSEFYSDFFELNQHDSVFRPFDPLMRRLVDKKKNIVDIYGHGTPKRAKRIKRLMDGIQDFRDNLDPLYHRFTVTNGWLPERGKINP